MSQPDQRDRATAEPSVVDGESALVAGRDRVGRTLLALILPAVLLIVWAVLAASGRFSISQLPPPASVWTALSVGIDDGSLIGHLTTSLRRVLTGFAAGSAAALVTGVAVGLLRPVQLLLAPTLGAIRAVPSLAWVPLLIIWLGIAETPKITLIAIGAFFPVFTTTVSGFAHVDRNLIEVGRAFGLRGINLVVRILLPAASPSVFAGLRLGLAQAWLFLVAAELIASSRGLGFMLVDSQNTGRTDVLVLAIILLALLGKISDVLIGSAEKRVLRWAR
jgi:sulfonate transport system permease protein